MKVGIVPTPGCNLGSLVGAVTRLSADWKVIESRNGLSKMDCLVLPGVGSFRSAMRDLERRGLAQAIRTFASNGQPILGICLGMQLLTEGSSEGGETTGLGIVRGNVTSLKTSPDSRVPHVGWNSVYYSRPHYLLDDIPSGTDFYFVHSFAMHNLDGEHTVATTQHGDRFVSMVGRENITGVQFHPEKSQKQGSRLLRNFLFTGGAC